MTVTEAVGGYGGDRSACTSRALTHPFSRYYIAFSSVRSFSSHHEARVASRLPSTAPTESRLGCCDAADAVADDGSRDALSTGIRRGRSRCRDVFRHRRAVFVQSAVDRSQPTTLFGVPSTPWTAAAFTRTERLSVPLLHGWSPAKVVFPSSGGAVAFAAATSTAA